MKIYILGICGTFMSGVAQLAIQKGFQVSGCDENIYPPISDVLKDLGVKIDKGYSENPPEYVALYSVDIDEEAGDTLFVDSRIVEDIPDYYRKHKDDKVQFDMNRFIHDNQYGYHFRNEVERRWFRRKYRNVEHELIQGDNRGVYLYYCEAYNNLPEMQMIKEKLYDPKRIHRHKWQKGQLLIYNNKATNHKRENGGKKRHLWKIALYKR